MSTFVRQTVSLSIAAGWQPAVHQETFDELAR
jgi:hypothetical protein